MGLNAENGDSYRHIERDVAREAAASRAHAELEGAIDRGGVIEAFVRALCHIAEPSGEIDDQGFAALREVGRMLPPEDRPGFALFKEIVRHQSLILHLDEARAIDALPKLATTPEDRRVVLESLGHMGALRRPKLSGEQQRRIARIEMLLGASATRPLRRECAAVGK